MIEELERAKGYQGKTGDDAPKPCTGKYTKIHGLPCHHRLLVLLEDRDPVRLAEIDSHYHIIGRAALDQLAATYGTSTAIVDATDSGARPGIHPFAAPHRVIDLSGEDDPQMNFNPRVDIVLDPPTQADRRGAQVKGPDIRIGAAQKNSTRNNRISKKKRIT